MNRKVFFTSFHQAHVVSSEKGGVGLGLAIVESLVTKMGGNVSFKSIENKGTSFRVILKLEITDQSIADPSQDGPQNISGNILVAEDVEDHRILLRAFLKDYEVQIDFAMEGRQAFEKRKQNQYDLILMDMNMPVINGYESIRMIREWEKNSASESIPILGLSAYADKESIKKCIDAGASDYLTKPIKKTLLLNALENYLVSN